MNGNTILITGGGTGIGRALAGAFRKMGNAVVITGRRREPLEEACATNPGMSWATLDVADAEAIKTFAAKIVVEHPALNVVVHNAGNLAPAKGSRLVPSRPVPGPRVSKSQRS